MFGFLGKGDRGFTIILLGIVVALVFFSRERGQYGWSVPGGAREMTEEDPAREEATVLYSRSLGREEESTAKEVTAELPLEKTDAKNHKILFSRKIGVDSDEQKKSLNVLYNRIIK